MSRTYKAADKLKLEILYTAENYFKEYGYDKTTYQIIADKLHISKASIAYHFKTKPWIIYRLCEKFIDSVYLFIRKNIGEDFNYYEYHCIAHLIIYREILKSKQNMDLFFHKDHVAIWEEERIHIIENYYKEIITDFKKESDEEELRAIAVMNIGAKLSIFKKYKKAPNLLDIDKYCRYMMHLVGVLSKLDEATVERNIDRAFSFANRYNLPGTPMLG